MKHSRLKLDNRICRLAASRPDLATSAVASPMITSKSPHLQSSVSSGCVPDETGAKKFDFSEKSNFWAGQG
jgi:hypothetical protein